MSLAPRPGPARPPRRGWSTHGLLLTLVAAVVCALAGCGPRNHSVKGKVTFKENGKPLSAGVVLFRLASDPNVQASGDLEEDGSYELGNSRGMGAIAGDYEVCVEPKTLEDRPEVLPVDPKYTDFKTSGLRYTVKPGGNEFNIQVERNPLRKR